MYYIKEHDYRNATLDTIATDRTIDNAHIAHITPCVYPLVYNDDNMLVSADYDYDVEAVHMLALNVVSCMARHLAGLGRADMIGIDHDCRIAYIRYYSGMTAAQVVYHVDRPDTQDLLDTAVCAIIDSAYPYSVQRDTYLPVCTGYYKHIVTPVYKAVNSLVWGERKQAHKALTDVLATYDVDSRDYVAVDMAAYLNSARNSASDGDLLKCAIKALTPIQYGVLYQLCKGLSYRAIAAKLDRSLPTIQGHVQALRKIFGNGERWTHYIDGKKQEIIELEREIARRNTPTK